MKKLLTTLLFACAAFCGIHASKAITTPFQVTLQDGRTVMVQFHGDEHFSFYTTIEGELVIFENNSWRIATENDKQKLSAKQKATDKRKVNEQIKEEDHPFPHKGTPKALVIMVDFKNMKFTYTKNDINKLLNGKDYDASAGYHSYGSAAQYFSDCSNGKFRPQFDIVGPYHLPNNYEVYGKGDDDMNTFITDACTAADADVNFADYDADGDGFVDLVYIIYAGYSAQYGEQLVPNAIWPKSGRGNYGKYDGKNIYRYGVNNELAFHPTIWKDLKVDEATFKPYLTGIGVFIHEMSHTMGLPDFYPTVNWTDITKYDNQSMEEWDIMDGGENTYYGFYPAPYTAWERQLLEWTDKMEVLKSPSNVTLKSIPQGGKGYMVMNDNDVSGNEYYVLENIENGNGKGWYSKMPGNGMLVTHINYDADAFSNFNRPNNTAGSPRITILPANGTIYSCYHYSKNDIAPQYVMTSTEVKNNWKGNTYPGTQNVTSITNWKPFVGTMSKDITNITKKSDGSITFAFMGGFPIISFPKTEITTDGTASVANALKVENARSDGKITYTSSNTAIATVDANGNVKGIVDGTATITATYTYNNGKDKLTATFKVTVKRPVPVLTFSKTEITTDGSATVTNTLNVKNTRTDGKTTYTSSNTAVATVDANGNVKGIADGTATITATYTYNGGKEKATATYKVTVKFPVPVLTFTKTELTTDGSATVTNTLNVKNTRTDGKTTYTSSNTTVATIDANGNVKGIADGTATITATYTYNSGKEKVSATYKVTVKFPVPVLTFTKTELTTDGTASVTNTLNIKNKRSDGKTTYTSSNTAVATVDANGNIKGIANGTATITATYSYNSGKDKVTAAYKVTVKLKPTAIEEVSTTESESSSPIYTIEGKYVGTSKENLKSGIYIQNRKKFKK